MPDAYSQKTIKNPGSEKNAECGMRNWESIQSVFIPHSAFRIPLGFNRIIPSVGVNGRGRYTMGLRRLESPAFGCGPSPSSAWVFNGLMTIGVWH